MGNNYQEFIRGLSFTSDLKTNVELFLNYHGEYETFIHTSKVAEEALRLAGLFGVDSKLAEHAALLHDISNVIPKSEMLNIAMNTKHSCLRRRAPISTHCTSEAFKGHGK